jgi:hypothetical protein
MAVRTALPVVRLPVNVKGDDEEDAGEEEEGGGRPNTISVFEFTGEPWSVPPLFNSLLPRWRACQEEQRERIAVNERERERERE